MKSKKIVGKHIRNQVRIICTEHALDEGEKATRVCELAGYEGMARFLDGLDKQTAKLTQLQKEYKEFFFDLLSKHGVSSPAELNDAKKKEFFKEVRDRWATGEGVSKSKNMTKQDEDKRPQEKAGEYSNELKIKNKPPKGLTWTVTPDYDKSNPQLEKLYNIESTSLKKTVADVERAFAKLSVDFQWTWPLTKEVGHHLDGPKMTFWIAKFTWTSGNKQYAGYLVSNQIVERKKHTAGTETAARMKNKKKKEKTIWHAGSMSGVLSEEIV